MTKGISPSLQKERRDASNSDSSGLRPAPPRFGVIKVILYRVPGNRAHTVCFRYAVTGPLSLCGDWPGLQCHYLNL